MFLREQTTGHFGLREEVIVLCIDLDCFLEASIRPSNENCAIHSQNPFPKQIKATYDCIKELVAETLYKKSIPKKH